MNRMELSVVGLLLAVGAGAGLYAAHSHRNRALEPGLSSAPLPSDEIPLSLPPLAESDEFVRRRAGVLSGGPAFQEWLKLESLIPRLVSAMSLISQGGVPRDIFSAFAPRGKFTVIKKGGKTLADPAGFARFDAFANTVVAIDPSKAAKLFEELMPLFDAAQRGLGDRNGSAREAFLAAARELLDAPVLKDGDVVLKQGKKGLGWVYADEKLESRSLAQKQLMRMGAKNQLKIQAALGALTRALDAPQMQLGKAP